MGLLVLPVSKNSYLAYVFHISWESMILYHRILGATLYICIAAHMFLWWGYVYKHTACCTHCIIQNITIYMFALLCFDLHDIFFVVVLLLIIAYNVKILGRRGHVS